MGSGTLKPGWTRVAFGDVVRLSTERSSNPAAAGFDRYVGLEHLDPGELRIQRWGGVAAGTTFTSVFRPGQVLFGKRRAYLRKVAVPDFSGVCSGDIYVFGVEGRGLPAADNATVRLPDGSVLPARRPHVRGVAVASDQLGRILRRSSSPYRRWMNSAGLLLYCKVVPNFTTHPAARLPDLMHS